MMKAEVTAENRPACDLSQDISIRETLKTHEYQGCVEVLIVFLVEFLVVFLGHLTVVFVEPGAKLFLGGWGVLFLAANGHYDTLMRDAA